MIIHWYRVAVTVPAGRSGYASGAETKAFESLRPSCLTENKVSVWSLVISCSMVLFCLIYPMYTICLSYIMFFVHLPTYRIWGILVSIHGCFVANCSDPNSRWSRCLSCLQKKYASYRIQSYPIYDFRSDLLDPPFLSDLLAKTTTHNLDLPPFQSRCWVPRTIGCF